MRAWERINSLDDFLHWYDACSRAGTRVGRGEPILNFHAPRGHRPLRCTSCSTNQVRLNSRYEQIAAFSAFLFRTSGGGEQQQSPWPRTPIATHRSDTSEVSHLTVPCRHFRPCVCCPMYGSYCLKPSARRREGCAETVVRNVYFAKTVARPFALQWALTLC